MKRTIPLLVGVAATVALVLPAWGASSKAPSAKESFAQYQSHERGQHRISGTITAINHKTGVIDVKTTEAALQLHYPPKYIHRLKKGEKITVDLAYAKIGETTGTASASKKTERAEKEHFRGERAEHWMTGQVTSVNAKTGMVDLKTAEAALALQFPPASIKDLKTGDRIAVQLAYQTGKWMKHKKM